MKYIRSNKKSYNIVKSSKSYGKFDNLEDAQFIRDELVKNDWDLDSIKKVYQFNGRYLVVGVIDGKIHILGNFVLEPDEEKIERLYKRRLRNPNNSKYGLNITKIFDTYIIKKQIAGEEHIFGYYDSLEDAEFVRNHLLENSWNVESFSQIQYDDERDTYNAVEIIDDKVYVLESSLDEDIDISKSRAEFLNKIKKHKMGLADHEHLEELTDKLPELEEIFKVKAHDEVWNLNLSGLKKPEILRPYLLFRQSISIHKNI